MTAARTRTRRLPEVFQRGQSLHPLRREAFERLLDGEHVACPGAPPDQGESQGAPPVVLAYDGEASQFYFEFQPCQDLELFVRRAALCRRVGALLECEQPLDAVLAAGDVPLVTLPRDPDLLQDVLRDALDEHAWQILDQEAGFAGQVAVCACGVGGCSSEYAIVEGGLCTLLVRVVAAELDEARLFPFAFLEPRAPRASEGGRGTENPKESQ